MIEIGIHALDPHGQVIPESPHLVAPAALHLTKRQLRQVRVLISQQIADEARGDLGAVLQLSHVKQPTEFGFRYRRTRRGAVTDGVPRAAARQEPEGQRPLQS